MVKLGTLLKLCREKSGLSQEELAWKLERTQACISKFENNYRTPDIDTFVAWCNYTGTPELAIAYLYGIDGLVILQKILNIVDLDE